MSAPVAGLTARRLDVLLAQEQARGRLPSIVGGLVRDGSLVWTGSVSALDGFETGPDVQYRIGSITKTLVAVLVLQLRDEGLLDLNDRLDAHLPGIAYARPHPARPAGARDRHARRARRRVVGADPGRRLRGAGRRARRLGAGVRGRGHLPLHQRRLRAARRAGRAAPGHDLVGAGRHPDPRAARDDPDDVPAAGAARHRVERAPLRGHADPRARPRRRRDGPGRPGVEHGHRPGPLRDVPARRPPRRAAAGDPRRDVHPPVGCPCLGAGLRARSRVPDRPRRCGDGVRSHRVDARVPRRVVRRPGPTYGGGDLRQRHDRDALRPAAGRAARVAGGLGGHAAEAVGAGRDLPAAVAEILGVWHWGNTAFEFSWDGTEVAVAKVGPAAVRTCSGRRTTAPSSAPPATTTARCCTSYATTDGSINHLLCETFVYTRVPYDPAAPIPAATPDRPLAPTAATCCVPTRRISWPGRPWTC